MKNFVLFTFGVALLAWMNPMRVALMADEANETYSNLYASVQGETNASAAYTAFAAKALEEGYPVIARLFLATADAEAKHAEDEWAILQGMGATVRPVAETPTVGTTAENLQVAFDGETYEYTEMYPGFVATAEAEDMTDAKRIFNLAMRAEQVHAGNFEDVLANLDNADYLNEKYNVVFRCPVCGEVVTERPGRCPICGQPSDNFVSTLENAVPEALVTKLTGNKNLLTVTVTEMFIGGMTTTVTGDFMIDNNAAAIYNVGSYKVYVDTKGNVQIRECYIVD